MTKHKMTATEVREAIEKSAMLAADDWFRKQCRNVLQKFHLYFRRGEINFAIMADYSGEGWELAWPEAIPRNFTVEDCRRWIIEKSRNLPIIPA